MGFAELARACRINRVQLSAAGYYQTPEIHWDRATATGKPFFYFAFGAACSEVVIDALTGEMKTLARRHPPRRRRLDQSGARSRPGRRRLHPGARLADDRGAGVRRQGAPDHPRAVDLQDPGRLRRAARLPHPPAHAAQPDRKRLPLQGGRRAAVDAGDRRLFGDPRRGACDRAEGQPKLEAPCTPEAILNAIRSIGGSLRRRQPSSPAKRGRGTARQRGGRGER